MMGKKIVGIDFGTSSVKMYRKSAGVVLKEKNVVAMQGKKKLLAAGNDAFDMFGKSPEKIEVSLPIRNGVIADIGKMQLLLNCLLGKLYKGKIKSSDYVVAVPTDITEVEKRAFYDLIQSSNAKSKMVYMIDKPLVAALGMDIDVASSRGILSVDIGADTTEVAVISLEGIVVSKLLPIGGYKFDQLIQSAIKKKYSLLIGDKTAETVKIQLASAFEPEHDTMRVFGRDVVSGLPSEVMVDSELVYNAIKEPISSILTAIRVILERTPPEISADIISTGVYVSGGCAQIRNLDKRIEDETKLKVNISEEPELTVIKGLGKIAENRKLIRLASSVKR